MTDMRLLTLAKVGEQTGGLGQAFWGLIDVRQVKKPPGTSFHHEKDGPTSLRGDLKGRGRELAVFEAEASPFPQAPGLSVGGGRDSLTGCSQPLVLSRSLGLPSVDIINLSGAPAQNWTSLFFPDDSSACMGLHSVWVDLVALDSCSVSPLGWSISCRD